MNIQLYNTLTKKKEEFKPIQAGQVGLYSCGPTVYNFAHIGNLRAYLFADVLKRVLKLNGLEVKHVMNITDVGHLATDADTGEDKVEKAARQSGKSAWELAEMYTKAFKKDLEDLNIIAPDVWCKATDHVEEQIALVKTLEEKGFTYKTGDGIYFDTSKFSEYGKLSGQKLGEKKAGARVAVRDEKKHPADFALWKFSPKNEKRQMEWVAPWGKGFPGWHLECSAMSVKYLGQPFDIHTGGIDHIPVHHENEIAQSVAAYGKPLANYWMHSDFLIMDEKKMSKSAGTFMTLRDLVMNSAEALAYRLFFFNAHYRAKLNFTFDALRASANALRTLRATLREWDEPMGNLPEYEKKFLERANDDLDLPGALAVMWEMVKDQNAPTAAKAASILYMDRVLGLNLQEFIGKKIEIPEGITALVEEREKARLAKDWLRADELRLEIELAGFKLEDSPTGPKLRADH
ncbi:MAG: cysteine--tRNA ligase [bacterium]